jgi:glycosyltransferase involved in cell wall biosynthesis
VSGLSVVTPYGRAGASARVRVYDWLEYLAAPHRLCNYLGARNASPQTLLARIPDVVRAERSLRALDLSRDVLLLQREASPLSRGHLEQSLLRRALRSVYDFDDALQWDSVPGLRSAFPKPLKTERCVRAADLVVAGNDLLADWASRFSREVHVVPSCIEPDQYPVKTDYDLTGQPVLGWVGSPTTEPHLKLVEDPLLEMHRRTGARLVVVSAGAAPLGALEPIVTRVEWNPVTVGRVMTSFDVAIAPLIETLFARGKCAYKVLQYAACGLPVVGSPVGANREVLGRLGLAAVSHPSEWPDQLEALLAGSADARRALGERARLGVVQHYSYAAWASVMSRLLGVPTDARLRSWA